MMKTHPVSPRRARGSALIIALVMALVLTIVAVGLAYFSSTEDRISGNDKLQKQGFYAAETGLRVGEAALNGAMTNTTSVSNLLQVAGSLSTPPTNGSPNTLDLHDSGYQAILLKIGPKEFRDLPVTFSSGSTRDNPYYTLYIRNDQEDQGPGHSATVDTNKVINLISVGYIQLPNGQRITKILEEQISAVDAGTGSGYEKGANEGGTNG